MFIFILCLCAIVSILVFYLEYGIKVALVYTLYAILIIFIFSLFVVKG